MCPKASLCIYMSQACLLICILADIQGEIIIIETLDENKSVNKCADEPSSMLVDNCRGKMYDGCGQYAILTGAGSTQSRNQMTHTNSRPVTGKMPQNVTERPTFGINSVVTHST